MNPAAAAMDSQVPEPKMGFKLGTAAEMGISISPQGAVVLPASVKAPHAQRVCPKADPMASFILTAMSSPLQSISSCCAGCPRCCHSCLSALKDRNVKSKSAHKGFLSSPKVRSCLQ